MSDIRTQSNQSLLGNQFSSGETKIDKTSNPQNSSSILLLPSQLVNYRNKNYFVSAAIMTLGIAFSFYIHEWTPVLMCTLFAAFFLWKGVAVESRYSCGKIAELTATCTGIMPSFYRDRFTVTFAAQSEDDDYVYYKFIVPNKHNREEFIIGAMYVIYFDRDSVRTLLGYLLVGPSIV
ncbi:MAG: hypothetical protein K6C08_10380 [Oscillospiraceae bacterium]|nr:hypothetical protein [Oscillospiraceae bacterium]